MVSYLAYPGCFLKELHRWGVLVFSPVVELAECLFEMGVFEMAASAIKASCQAVTWQSR